jgi:hypothetical protein
LFKELMNLWIVPLILMTETSLNASPTLNLADAEALTVDNTSTMVKSINAPNPVNATDSEDQEDVNESKEKEEEDTDIEEEDG